MTTLINLLVVLIAISHGCLSQSTSTNDVATTVSITTQQMTSMENVSSSPSPMLCNQLRPGLVNTCQRPGRNSQFAYPQLIPGVQGILDASSVEILIFAIQTLDPQPPQECIDAAVLALCIFLAPPCDPISDLRLPICERSCEAVTRLRAEGSCVQLDNFVSDLALSLGQFRFEVLRDLYFAFDCRNSSTYDFYDGTLNYTQHGECTSIISPNNEDLVLNKPPVCKPVPMGHCSQLNPTGYFFETSQLSHDENTVMELLNMAEILNTDVEICRNKELLTDLVCLFVYPSCIPQNRTQVAICEESCTNLNTFISECIPFNDGQNDMDNSSIVDVFFSTIMNLTCSDNSRSYLIPGAVVSKSVCIRLKMSTLNRNDILVVIIVLCLVAGLAIITIAASLIIVFVRLRQRKHKSAHKVDISFLTRSQERNPYDGLEILEREFENAGCCETEDIVHLSETDIEDYRKLFSSVLVPYTTLKVGNVIGQGAFGKVFKGQISMKDSEVLKDVAIKTIKNLTSQEELKAFFSESLIMKDFDHPNVLGLAGVCFDTPDGDPFLILPFMVNGSLKDYLKKSRRHLADVDSLPEGLPLSGLIQMCLDIVSGMKYLAEKKFVHRDLAARNCMVDSKLRIKVGDFGLARDVYSSDYYRANRSTKIPVKWMPPETLHDGISNETTDVWSYGVTCWEVFSLGRTPYPGIDNHDVLNFISTGGRLEKPSLCPVEIYSIVKLCWELKPEDRPNFNDIFDQMEDYWDREHSYI